VRTPSAQGTKREGEGVGYFSNPTTYYDMRHNEGNFFVCVEHWGKKEIVRDRVRKAGGGGINNKHCRLEARGGLYVPIDNSVIGMAL